MYTSVAVSMNQNNMLVLSSVTDTKCPKGSQSAGLILTPDQTKPNLGRGGGGWEKLGSEATIDHLKYSFSVIILKPCYNSAFIK